MRHLVNISLVLILAIPAWANWPQFRGPDNDGIAPPLENGEPRGLPIDFNEEKNVVWKVPVPYEGFSTPVIWDNQIWLTAATEDGRRMFVYCYDKEKGETLYENEIFTNPTPRPLGNDVNTYASCSAVAEEGRVYVHFGSYGTAAIDTNTFETLWTQRDLPCNHYRGPASSPVIFEDLLILTFDGADLQYQAALNKDSGEVVWKTDRTTNWQDLDVNGEPKREGDFRKAFSTPLIVEHNDKPMMFISGSYGAFAYDPRTGEELWKVDHDSYSNACMALYGHGYAYLISGRGRPSIMAVRPDGEGNVTDTHIDWSYTRGVPSMPSGLLIDDLIYFIHNNGVITCLDAKTGEEQWKTRLEGNQYYASLIYADGHIYAFAMDALVSVIKPGREFNLVNECELEEGFMASAAVDGSALYLRTVTHLYRIEETP